MNKVQKDHALKMIQEKNDPSRNKIKIHFNTYDGWVG